MFDEAKGFVLCKGLPAVDTAVEINDKYWMIDKRLHKFRNDEILRFGNDFSVLDGYVSNKLDLCERRTWEESFVSLEACDSFPSMLRGSFCGVSASEGCVKLYVDHVGSRVLYYYHSENVTMISSRYIFIVELLRQFDIEVTPDEQAVKYMLEKGFMIDDTTFCKDIKRVEPGYIVDLYENGEVVDNRYYAIDNTHPTEMTIDEAIDGIDKYFRQAVKREFDKDIEYGYEHMVDLSGGLDSRMTVMVAHDMGYKNQFNYTYCKSGYLDHKISEQIACDLGHMYFFMPLDDFGWFNDMRENSIFYNGAAVCCGMTGANRFLKNIDCSRYGIEHTGMIGDAILSTFFNDKVYNYSKPNGKEKSSANLCKFDIPIESIAKYENKEQFAIHTRGMLGAQTSYFVRQNHVECSSPFMDVDFLDFVFRIPFELRRRYIVYFEWIKRKYPTATKYGWESWYGIRPLKRNVVFVKMRSLYLYLTEPIRRLIFKDYMNGMAPMDYWLANNLEIQNALEKRFKETIDNVQISTELIEVMEKIFVDSGAVGKATVLTCIEMLML